MLANHLYRIMKSVSKFLCFTLYLPLNTLSSKSVPHRGIIFGQQQKGLMKKPLFRTKKSKKKPGAALFYRSVQHQAMLE